MTNKTVQCKHPGCAYTARREVTQGMRGMRNASPGYGRCPQGHGDLVERKVQPKHRKPLVAPDGRLRRHR